jgi:hypothetical protein
MSEKLSGEGKVYKRQQFIADVHYELELHSRYKMTRTHTSEGPYAFETDVILRISPATAISRQSGVERLTLHLSDGRKQEFYVSSGSGDCTATGGPHE